MPQAEESKWRSADSGTGAPAAHTAPLTPEKTANAIIDAIFHGLTLEEIAAALTYVRREWEHGADPVDEKTVSEVREATKDRVDMWTASELLELK